MERESTLLYLLHNIFKAFTGVVNQKYLKLF